MCKGTKLAIPQRGISYGLSRAEATLIMREAYPTAALELENGKLSVVFYDPPHETFAFFDLFFEKDSLVGLDFAYTPAFISQLGGYDSAVVAIYKKAMEKYGEAAKLDKTEKTLKTSWAVQNGGDLTLYAGRPQTVLMSYSCVELKNALSAK